MGKIAVLDQNMINMISAGEVIERPASVVKELMENSVDAGATQITVTIEDGGRKLMSVTDNGCGMDAGDLAGAFEPHATSKIKTTSDLQTISTLGFRGEALASIASVAQVKAVSRTQESPGANCLEIDCGQKAPITACGADYGTTIEVRDLFYKLPARRKFLKTANTEVGHIIEHFTRMALANANLDMTLIHNNREIYRLGANQSLRQRISELFSSEISENLIETESDEKGLHVFGLLGRPNVSRTNNKFQYTFLNGRFIRDKFISHAVKEAYRGRLEPNRYPITFLFIQMPPEDVDVNVHPTKIEVRFYNSNLVHSQILGCLREKLLSTEFNVDAKLPATHQRSQEINDAMAEFFKKHKPVQTQQQLGFSSTHRANPIHKDFAYRGGNAMEGPAVLPSQQRFIQIHDSYIVWQTDTGFVIIDQHALHEQIIYEDLCRRIKTSKLESQKLLIPQSFELTDAHARVLKSHAELIEKLGIELVSFGPGSMAVQSFPTLLAKTDPVDFVSDLIDILIEENNNCEAERLLDDILKMAACKAAIKAGQKLSDAEIEHLLADKATMENSSRCPHGRPTTINFSIPELEKQFKRT